MAYSMCYDPKPTNCLLRRLDPCWTPQGYIC